MAHRDGPKRGERTNTHKRNTRNKARRKVPMRKGGKRK